MSVDMIARIIENKRIADDVYSLRLHTGHKDIRPGQFFNVYLNNQAKLLPRPLSVCDVNDDGSIRVVYKISGDGTLELSTYDGRVRILGPLGNGFELRHGSGILVGGGMGVAPLLYLARKLDDPVVMLGFSGESILVDEFKEACNEVHVIYEDKRRKGTVLDLIRDIGVVNGNYYACGPEAMLRGLVAMLEDGAARSIQVSLEQRMGCGYGACVGCTCRTLDGLQKVCTDGPVFDGMKVLWE